MTRIVSSIFLFALLAFGEPAGQYLGTWSSDGGVNSGKVTLVLSATGECDLTFTYQDQPVKLKKVMAKLTGQELEFVSEIELEGLKLKTAFHGTLAGKDISGKYVSTSAGDDSVLDTGTWKVTQQ